jgi:hypothetical protein
VSRWLPLYALPTVATIDALRLVHAKKCAALSAGPINAFLGDEGLYANSLNALQIRDDAYSSRVVAIRGDARAMIMNDLR